MTAPCAARDCKAFVAGLSLTAVLGCFAFNYLDSGHVTGPTSSAAVSGGEMIGNINTGVGICDPAETKRNIAVTLSQQ